MSAAATVSAYEAVIIKRITGKTPKNWEIIVLNPHWLWFEDYQGRAYWLHIPTETLLESSRNRGKE